VCAERTLKTSAGRAFVKARPALVFNPRPCCVFKSPPVLCSGRYARVHGRRQSTFLNASLTRPHARRDASPGLLPPAAELRA
jgi:hypothetical protein